MQTIQQLVGDEQARLIRVLNALSAAPEPFARQMQAWRRECRVVELMHLAGNKPKIEVV